MVNVMQIRLKMYLLKDIPASKIQAALAAFIDKELRSRDKDRGGVN